MKINLNKIKANINKNIEIILLFFLIFTTILSTQLYNLNKEKINKNYIELANNIYFQKTLGHIFSKLKPKYLNIKHKISPGETFNGILSSYKVPQHETKKVIKILSKSVNLNNLNTDAVIIMTLDQLNNKEIVNITFPVSRTKKISLIKNLNLGSFTKREIITNLNKIVVFKEGKISQSLYKSAMNLKIKPNIIIEFARIYGFQIDFQRDIRKNDTFQIMHEVFQNDKGEIFSTGNIIFANLKLRGQNNSLYYFNNKSSKGHYDANGKSIKKALMKTPINGAKLSSSFGMRKHPIDGYNKMHKGTDFAAPEGTPIMASGDGVVVRAKWCGRGGNCIKIKHNNTYSTIYAHMKNFASGIRTGARVKQGQTIGFVGSTGKSTGPHLHYEVIANGKKINSQKLKLPSGNILKAKERRLFEISKIKIDVLKSELILGIN